VAQLSAHRDDRLAGWGRWRTAAQHRRPDLATLVLAVIRGLLMDLDATGDTTRTDRAFHDFLGAVEHLSSGRT
jgi:hypothetical protein